MGSVESVELWRTACLCRDRGEFSLSFRVLHELFFAFFMFYFFSP